MNKVYFVLFSCMVVVLGQNINWVNQGTVKDAVGFFNSVMQETVFELERRGFSNLKLVNVTKKIEERMYKWLVNGTVVYTNGFLVSNQKIEVTNQRSEIGNPTVDEKPDPRAIVTGQLHFRNPNLGYDVIFTPVDGTTPQIFTGEYLMSAITWHFSITKNYTNNAVSMTSSLSTSAGSSTVRMIYRPATNLTEVLSRDFFAYDNYDGIMSWRATLEEIVLDVIRTKIPFPELCYGQC